MKYLTVLLVLAVAFWLWRSNRKADKVPPPKPSSAKAPGTPQPMLRCAACGLHLPQSDALTGRQGSYCSAAHLKQLEGG